MSSTIPFVYTPASPKIEPGECVEWRSAGFTHSSSADPCPDDVLTSCGSPSPPACHWDSGDVAAAGTPPSAVCYYDPAAYPPTTVDGFYCRIHDNPAHTGTMHGTLAVTTPIDLTVDKNAGAGSVVLTWTGGGVTGDVTYKVVRSNAGDPAFPAAGITTFNPDGGTAGTQFTDAGELAGPAIRYYLIRNRQINE
jgi:plastocyanin